MNSDPRDHGLEAIHLATVTGEFEQVIKLICEGADTNARTPEGVTPMMLSSLMGHKDITDLLIRKGADARATDHAGLTACDYTNKCETNETKRAYFIDNNLGKEDSLAVETRREIAETLMSPARLRALRKATDLGYRDFVMAKWGTKIVTFVPFDILETGFTLTPNKTIAQIKARHAVRPLRYAVSGWSALPQLDTKILDSKHWNHIALHHIAPKIGFSFRRSRHDGGKRVALPEHIGRMRASHVEVQLATFYVLWATARIVNEASASVEYLTRNLHKLRHDAKLAQERDAMIIMDHAPCNDCLRYIHALQQYTLLSFTIVQRPTVGRVRIEQRANGSRRDVVLDGLSDSDDDQLEELFDPEQEADPSVNNTMGDTDESDFEQLWSEGEHTDSGDTPEEVVTADAPVGSNAGLRRCLARLDDVVDPDSDSSDMENLAEGTARSPASDTGMSSARNSVDYHPAQSGGSPTQKAELVSVESIGKNDDRPIAYSMPPRSVQYDTNIDDDMSLSIGILNLTGERDDGVSANVNSERVDLEIIDLTNDGHGPQAGDGDDSESDATIQAYTPTSSRSSSPHPVTHHDAPALGALYARSAAAAAAAAAATTIDDLETPLRRIPDLQPESILGTSVSASRRGAASRRLIRSFIRTGNVSVDNRSTREPLPYRNTKPTPIWEDPYSSPAPTPTRRTARRWAPPLARGR